MTPLPGPVAWLTGEYPRATDTFIQREVTGLRALGVDVRTFTIRRTVAAHHVGPEQQAEAAGTLAVLPLALRPSALLAHWEALRRPGYLAAWATAWQTAARGARGRLMGLAYLHEAVVLAALLRHLGAVHLHCHIAMAACTVARLAAPLAGVTWSFTLHGPDDLREPVRWRLDDKVAAATFVACISDFARAQAMLESAPEHWDKLHVVHCGVEPARYARPRSARPGALLFVGRLAAAKGLPILLDALVIARARRPDLSLTLVGDGPLRADIERRVAEAGATLLGYRSQEEVAALLASHAALVLPSFAEGVPVVLMEAMAAGLPVVATRVGGVAELVEDGRSGLLVAPGDAEALADAILAALADERAARAMGEEGRLRVERDFDSRREAEGLLRLLQWARGLGPRPPKRPGVA